MPNKLKPCPWCGSDKVGVDFYADIHGHRIFSVFCDPCDRAISGNGEEDSAIAAWNALPRAPHWTEYDGSSLTLPGEDEQIILSRHQSSGHLFCGSAKPCWWVDARKDFVPLLVGDRWLQMAKDALGGE